jgi:hypothetical protein
LKILKTNQETPWAELTQRNLHRFFSRKYRELGSMVVIARRDLESLL